MKRIVSLLFAAVLTPLILCQSAAVEGVSSSVPLQQNSGSIQKAVVFTLDASNSMNGNDRNCLAIDSIAQLIYSLPSNYVVGVVAYNTDAVATQGMVDSGSRDNIMKVTDSVRYTGYTNAGAGFTKALELLGTVEASKKTVVVLSNGEIVIQDDAVTVVSFGQLENAVIETKNSGVVIHMIGLGADMENKANTIFSASAKIDGVNYHVPRAKDIQQAVDSTLLEQLNIKKTTVVVMDTDGGMEELDITIPTVSATNVRLLLISDSPIRNLNADFSAGSVRQTPGTHYTLLKLDYPSAERVHVSFQGAASSQVKVDVITEYHIILTSGIVYEDTEPADEDAVPYDRIAQISVVFYDVENPERQVLIDSVFEGCFPTGAVDGQAWSRAVRTGLVTLPPQGEAPSDKTKAIYISFDNLDANIIAQQTVSVPLEGAPPLPEPSDYRLVIIEVSLFVPLSTLGVVYAVVSRRRKRPRSILDPSPPAPSKYNYTGRLNFYITWAKSGGDVPPLTYNLFRTPDGKILTLQEIPGGCNVSESLEDASRIYFKAGVNRCLVPSDESDRTIMQAREILIKGHSYLIGLDPKVDITLEGEISEVALQHRRAKPNELRSYART